VAGQTLSLLSQRFRGDYAALPESTRRDWWRLVGAGVIGLFALMVALRVAAAAAVARNALAWEKGFLESVGTLPLGFSDAVFFQTFGSDITLAILVSAATAAAIWKGRPLTALSVVLAVAATDLVTRFGWLIWDRARPGILYDGVASPGFHSFPSGHAAKTAAVYGILAVAWARSTGSRAERLVALTLAALIAVVTAGGRVAMGVHWPSDAVAGLLLGGFWAAVLARGLRYEKVGGGREYETVAKD
jgi:membrane-associated phospholipid phosphatase